MATSRLWTFSHPVRRRGDRGGTILDLWISASTSASFLYLQILTLPVNSMTGQYLLFPRRLVVGDAARKFRSIILHFSIQTMFGLTETRNRLQGGSVVDTKRQRNKAALATDATTSGSSFVKIMVSEFFLNFAGCHDQMDDSRQPLRRWQGMYDACCEKTGTLALNHLTVDKNLIKSRYPFFCLRILQLSTV
jgi:hypothetical protein